VQGTPPFEGGNDISFNLKEIKSDRINIVASRFFYPPTAPKGGYTPTALLIRWSIHFTQLFYGSGSNNVASRLFCGDTPHPVRLSRVARAALGLFSVVRFAVLRFAPLALACAVAATGM